MRFTRDGVGEAAPWGLRQSRGIEFGREGKRSRSAINSPASLAGAYPCQLEVFSVILLIILTLWYKTAPEFCVH